MTTHTNSVPTPLQQITLDHMDEQCRVVGLGPEGSLHILTARGRHVAVLQDGQTVQDLSKPATPARRRRDRPESLERLERLMTQRPGSAALTAATFNRRPIAGHP